MFFVLVKRGTKFELKEEDEDDTDELTIPVGTHVVTVRNFLQNLFLIHTQTIRLYVNVDLS